MLKRTQNRLLCQTLLDPSFPESTVSEYNILRFCSADAAGVTRLVEGVYGDTYYPRDLYTPEQIVHLNESEKLVSIFALDSALQVIGHYALERPDLGAVAEASDASGDEILASSPFRIYATSAARRRETPRPDRAGQLCGD
jgi:hypothetical protein